MNAIRLTLASILTVAITGGFLPWHPSAAYSKREPAKGGQHPGPAATRPVVDEKPAERPRVEMVFALDTTGSMGGLIQGAKQKIWGIVNEVVKGQPTPEVRIGLVAYRDKGDAYVTQHTQLTGDLDAVYKQLMGLSAGGGGDTPENVNQALFEAVNKTEWSGKDTRALRVVFLVGDAPPQMYQDVPSYEETVKQAAQKNIIVNAIRCGNMASTATHWAKIAKLGGGEFLSINQSGGMLATATPFDDDLARLSGEMDKTYVMAGDEGKRRRAARELASADAVAGAGGSYAKAERAIFRAKSKAPAAPAAAAEADLVTAFEADEDAADAMLDREEGLSDELKGMSKTERKAHIKKKAEERQRIKDEMAEVAKKRDAWLAKKNAEKKDSFDYKVKELVKEQAAAEASIAY